MDGLHTCPGPPMDVRVCVVWPSAFNGQPWAVNSALPVGERWPALLTSTGAYLHHVLWAEAT